MSKDYEPDIDGPLAAVAQGVINIDSGLTTIEKDSRVYQGMLELIKLRQEGRLVLQAVPKAKPVKKKRITVKRCLACDDPDNHSQHSCGLRDLQKLLP